MARMSPTKLVALKVQPAVALALAELATDQYGRSVSALLRKLALEHIKANWDKLSDRARTDLDAMRHVRTRLQYVRREDRR